jgi:DNA-binding FrmR family transcriptional regulator
MGYHLPMQQAAKQDALRRMSLLEGQLSGIRRMIEQDRECVDILTQFSALTGALDKLGTIVLTDHIETMASDFTSGISGAGGKKISKNEMLHDIKLALGRYLK